LDAICRYLGIGKKIKTTSDLWLDVWRNRSSKAMNEMIKYCKMDVLILEEYFKILDPYIKPKSSIADYRCNCPNCNSKRMVINQRKVSAAGIKKVSLVCKDCGKYHTISEPTFNSEVKKRDNVKRPIPKIKF